MILKGKLRIDTNHFYSFSYSNENSDLAADLVKILSECQQEVPDYLANGGGGGGGMAAQGKILILNKLRHVCKS